MKNKKDTLIKSDTKRGVLHSLENHMSKTYEKIKEDGQYEYGKNLVKTYLVESNHNDPVDFYNSLKNSQNGYKKIKLNLERIENSFFILTISKRENEAIFYLDTNNPRFWVLHTKSNVKDSDYLLNAIIQPSMSHLDNLWLEKNMLGQIYKKHAKYLKSIGIQYRYGDVFPTDDVGETFTMRAHGSPSEKFLNLIKNNQEVSNYFAISSVGFKKESEWDNENELSEDVTIEDVNYWGKFTVKGNSFYQHMEIVDDIETNYENTLKIIETEFNLCYTKSKVLGSPICIELKKEISDIDAFIKVVFSSKEPFRLSGFSKRLDPGTALVAGLDLHNGDDFDLEITPEWMRMYLPEKACGNTILRFICNLQRYYDANASLEGIEYG